VQLYRPLYKHNVNSSNSLAVDMEFAVAGPVINLWEARQILDLQQDFDVRERKPGALRGSELLAENRAHRHAQGGAKLSL
jgi:hypothetical protein